MELVKYHNDINKIKTGSFTEKEIDIFFSILFKMKGRETKEIILEFAELKGLVESTQNNTRLMSQVRSMNRKIINLNQEIELPNGDIMVFNLFEKLVFSPKKRTLTAKITETFSYMLNDLIGNYTKFDLKALVSLKSGYSKQLFKLLKQYEGTDQGPKWYWVELKEFKDLLGVPGTYSTTNFNKKVLAPLETELGKIFYNFKIQKLTKDGKPVGRGKKTHSIKFTWEKRAIKEVPPIKYRGGNPGQSTEKIKAPELSEIDQLRAEVMKLNIPLPEKFKITGIQDLARMKEEYNKFI